MGLARSIESTTTLPPNWGAKSLKIWDLTDGILRGDVSDLLEEILSEQVSKDADFDNLKLQFFASLMSDVLRSGGKAWVRDSRIMLAWPDWEGPAGRAAAQRAMEAAREMRPLTSSEIDNVSPLFAPALDGEALSTVLAEGKFDLRSATDVHPTGVDYADAFAAALRYWTMPYRGRTGRMKRFVLTSSHPILGPHPVVAGILELGDEAPFCTWRDDLLGLSTKSAAKFLNTLDIKGLQQAAERLQTIRSAIREIGFEVDVATASCNDILSRRSRIEALSHGRSLATDDGPERLKEQKRLIYALRLARGEAYLRKLTSPGSVRYDDPEFGAGVRALHDLLLPRVHLEATVCGAVPPFAQALGGKLLTSFLSHPDVLRSVQNAAGELLGWSFDLAKLAPHLPSSGLLCLTTKGLYSGHAAIYNRASMPGGMRPIRMRHLANTEGTTTTLVTSQTAKLARFVVERATTRAVVSQVYGSGGSKRHRAIEAALKICGLPNDLANAGIRRPVYGVEFTTNAAAVAWLGQEPMMLVPQVSTSEEFSSIATALWRRRWLKKAVERIQDYVLVPSFLRLLEPAAPLEGVS